MNLNHRTSVLLNLFFVIALLVSLIVIAYSVNTIRSLESEAKGKPAVTVSTKKQTATLTVTPDPVTAGAEYTIKGSGFNENASVYIVQSTPFCCGFFTLSADTNGAITYNYPSGKKGIYKVEAYQRPHRTLKLMATVSFSVE